VKEGMGGRACLDSGALEVGWQHDNWALALVGARRDRLASSS
jgi:hypothetical protein